MDTNQPFQIAGETIAPGSLRDVAFPITTLAISTPASLGIRVLHGARPGPTVFVSAPTGAISTAPSPAAPADRWPGSWPTCSTARW